LMPPRALEGLFAKRGCAAVQIGEEGSSSHEPRGRRREFTHERNKLGEGNENKRGKGQKRDEGSTRGTRGDGQWGPVGRFHGGTGAPAYGLARFGPSRGARISRGGPTLTNLVRRASFCRGPGGKRGRLGPAGLGRRASRARRATNGPRFKWRAAAPDGYTLLPMPSGARVCGREHTSPPPNNQHPVPPPPTALRTVDGLQPDFKHVHTSIPISLADLCQVSHTNAWEGPRSALARSHQTAALYGNPWQRLGSAIGHRSLSEETNLSKLQARALSRAAAPAAIDLIGASVSTS